MQEDYATDATDTANACEKPRPKRKVRSGVNNCVNFVTLGGN